MRIKHKSLVKRPQACVLLIISACKCMLALFFPGTLPLQRPGPRTYTPFSTASGYTRAPLRARGAYLGAGARGRTVWRLRAMLERGPWSPRPAAPRPTGCSTSVGNNRMEVRVAPSTALGKPQHVLNKLQSVAIPSPPSTSEPTWLIFAVRRQPTQGRPPSCHFPSSIHGCRAVRVKAPRRLHQHSKGQGRGSAAINKQV